jgi:pSer/pThr/pTyr-binding forkhead associated (FHA) protein
MSVRFSCVDAASTVDDLVIQSLPITIGRGEDADICVNDDWASRHNCRLIEKDGQLWVSDLKSSNGTRLNGKSIDEHKVASGDELTIGITTFKISYSRLPINTKINSQQEPSQVAGYA